jgi:hypothetical protein
MVLMFKGFFSPINIWVFDGDYWNIDCSIPTHKEEDEKLIQLLPLKIILYSRSR